jgi:acetate kinase
MADALLVLNAGSSSLKFSVFFDDDPPRLWLRGQIEGLLTHPRFIVRDGASVVGEHEWPAGTRLRHLGAIRYLLAWGGGGVLDGHRLVGVGHRVVHGGSRFSAPALVDASVLAELEALVPLAPLHQPHNIAAIEAVSEMVAAMPQVVCFDTAFHRTQPEVAQMYALPRELAGDGIRRYGFHGLSYEHIARVLSACDPRAAAGRTVVVHLGNGASMCAMRAGRSVATTMGFTALDGLMMGTRCGAIDPGVVLYLLEERHLRAPELRRLLYERSGLLGVSGISSDMRTLLASAEPHAAEAVDLFVYRISRELGSQAAALGGIDALVFTGGIGEHSAAIRARVCRDAGWLGLQLNEHANERGGPSISTAGSAVSAWVIAADEELTIARHTRRLLALSGVRTRNRIAPWRRGRRPQPTLGRAPGVDVRRGRAR